MIRYVVKVCVGFAVGGVIAVVGILFFPLSLITYAIGGAIGGASLGRGWRPAIAFAIAFALPGLLIPLTLVAFQGMSTDSDVFFVPTIAFLFGFGVAGTLGSALSGLGSRMLLAAAAAFGVAGATGGAVIGVGFLVAENIAFEVRGRILLGAMLVGVLIPHALGGALLAVALEYPSHKRKKLGLCLKCGYDLRASTERCPECGEPIASASQPEKP